MSDNIPYEIQMEIIKMVPDVKSLIRFRSVSKPWKSFIDSLEFITGYGARDTQPHSLLLRYKDNFNVEKYVRFVDENENDNNILTQQQQDFGPNVPLLIKQLIYSDVIGSSCGLWALYGYDTSETEMVVIWNPSIRKCVGIVLPCVLNNTFDKISYTYFGFGVCPSTYDPTIVEISFQEEKDTRNITWQVGIFTLSSRTWKMIPTSNLPSESVRIRSSTQVAIDRFIFWVAYTANDVSNHLKDLILSFDLITHDFKEVNLPDSIANPFSLDFFISKLRESLVVSTYTVDDIGLVYGVWMMGVEGGVVTSFTKLFTISTPAPNLSVRKLLGFRKSGEPIMENDNDDEDFNALEVYEPCSEHINNMGIYGERGSFFICPYTEVLLLIDYLDGCIISNDY